MANSFLKKIRQKAGILCLSSLVLGFNYLSDEPEVKPLDQAGHISVSAESAVNERLHEQWSLIKGNRWSISDSTIEKEIKKHSPWILDFIENIQFQKTISSGYAGMYDTNLKTVHIPCMVLDREDIVWAILVDDLDLYMNCEQRIEKLKNKSKANACVEYINSQNLLIKQDRFGELHPDFQEKVLSIIDDFNERLEKKINLTYRVLDHELCHALIRSEFGLLNSQHYSGPDEKEISRFISRIFEKLAGKDEMLNYLHGFDKNIFSEFSSLEYFISADFQSDDKAKKYIRIMQEHARDSSGYVVIAFESDYGSSKKKLSFDDIKDEIFNQYWSTVKGKTMEEMLSEELVFVSENIESNSSLNMNYMMKNCPGYVLSIELIEGSNGTKDRFFNVYEDKTLKSLLEAGAGPYEIKDLYAFLAYSTSKNILVEESMARLFDDFASLELPFLYTSDPDLVESIVEFFGSFMYKGKKAFQKEYEKNKIAISLVKEDTYPLKAKRLLEYATSFEYKGKEYSWPENSFSFKDPVPFAE